MRFVAVVFLALGTSGALAAQHLVPTRTLLVKRPSANAHKVVWKVREPGNTALVGDPTVQGASLRVTLTPGGDQCFVLPAEWWSATSSGFRYRPPFGVLTRVAIKATASGFQLTVVARDTHMTVVPGNPTTAYATNFTLGTGDEYCGGTATATPNPNTESVFRVSNDGAPAGCPVSCSVPITTTTTSTTTTTLFPPCSSYSYPCGIVGSGSQCWAQCDYSLVCVDWAASAGVGCITDQDCAAYPGNHCIGVLYDGCYQQCAAPGADDSACVTSGAPACGGTCPAGSVCGQASGGNVCQCAALDHTCLISDAPACGGTCPSGLICGQHTGGDFCECVSPDNTCGISQAPTCGGTCPNGWICGQHTGGDFCECVSPDNTCGISQPPTCGGTCGIGQVCTSTATSCVCACDPALPCPFATKWGSPGSGNGQFLSPIGIAVDGSGNVFVADHGNNRIQKFDNTGTFLAAWGGTGSGDGQFDEPYGVAVDASGNVFVGDLRNNRIQKFDNNGTFLLAWGSAGSGNGQFNLPSKLAVDGSGSVFVADSGNFRIQKFDNTGTFLLAWGSAGSGDGQFVNNFFGVAVDGVGNVFVADNYRVQKFTNTGLFITKFGSGDCGLGVDGSGKVYEAFPISHRIMEWNNDGTFITMWGCPGTGNGQFNSPSAVAVDPSGHLFVADYSNRIQKFACQ